VSDPCDNLRLMGRKKLHTICPCGKPGVAKGLCRKCYGRRYYEANSLYWSQHPDPVPQPSSTCLCGAEIFILGTSQCKKCYDKQRYREKHPPKPPKAPVNCACGTQTARRDGRCKRCYFRALHQKYRLEHPDRIRETNKRRYRKRKDEWQARARRYRLANLDKFAAGHRKRRQNNPTLVREEDRRKHLKRRARAAGAQGTCTKTQLEARMAYFGNKCSYCGGPYETVDHVIPLAKGGSHWPANLRPACSKCNSSKQAKDWRPWVAAKRGILAI
jgi:5-methylcytosine-specific restriction endonuclease McrA